MFFLAPFNFYIYTMPNFPFAWGIVVITSMVSEPLISILLTITFAHSPLHHHRRCQWNILNSWLFIAAFWHSCSNSIFQSYCFLFHLVILVVTKLSPAVYRPRFIIFFFLDLWLYVELQWPLSIPSPSKYSSASASFSRFLFGFTYLLHFSQKASTSFCLDLQLLINLWVCITILQLPQGKDYFLFIVVLSANLHTTPC